MVALSKRSLLLSGSRALARSLFSQRPSSFLPLSLNKDKQGESMFAPVPGRYSGREWARGEMRELELLESRSNSCLSGKSASTHSTKADGTSASECPQRSTCNVQTQAVPHSYRGTVTKKQMIPELTATLNYGY